MTDPESLETAARNLRQTINTLQGTVEKANDVKRELDLLDKRGLTNRRLIWAVIVGFVLQLVFLVVMTGFAFQVRSVVQTQKVLLELQKDAALCPLYGIFIANDTPAAEQRAIESGVDVVQRREWFDIIYQSYSALDCTNNETR